jgi:hypothetical protein
MLSPYQTYDYKEWFAAGTDGNRIRPGCDCAFAQMADPGWYNNNGQWAFVSTPAHNAPNNYCSSHVPAGNDKALEVTTSSGKQYAGIGAGYTANLPAKGHVMNGWMFLNPVSFPAPNGAALSGFLYYANTARNYISMGVDAQNHPTLVRQLDADRAPPQVIATNAAVTIPPAEWHRFELRGSEDHYWSVLLDGQEVLNITGVDDNALWTYNAGSGLSSHFGISDHFNNANPLIAYFDDLSTGSTSFEDCFGWNPDFCPFQSGKIAKTPVQPAPALGLCVSTVGSHVRFQVPAGFEGGTIRVADMAGRSVWQSALAGTERKMSAVEWKGAGLMPRGTYFVLVEKNTAAQVRPFVLMR